MELNEYFSSRDSDIKGILGTKKEFLKDLYLLTSYFPKIKINAPIDLIATTSISENYIYLFLTNIKGICEACNSENKSLKDIKVSFNSSFGSEDVYGLPFLGEKEKISTIKVNEEISFTVPEIELGSVIIINR